MANPDRPNLLVFLTDDHAQWALGCYGHETVRSPTMDWLAAEGTRFENAFTPSPVCSPARASFWTGLIASAHGIHDYIFEPEHDQTHPGLLEQTTLAQRLHEHGYATGLIGKWHCGHCDTPHRGFDRWLVNQRTQARFGPQRFCDQGRWIERFGHQPPILTEYADQWLQQWQASDSDQPFFLCVGYTDTHTPLNCLPEDLVGYYRADPRVQATGEKLSPAHGHQRIIANPDPAIEREKMCHYLAAVTQIDRHMALLIDRLAAMGELDNTIIVYTADHGHGTGVRGLQTKGNDTVPCNFMEPSIRIPLMLRWPDHIEAGQRCDTMVDLTDTFATLLDLADVPFDGTTDGHPAPGRSFTPWLRGETGPDKSHQFGEYGNARMVRTRTLKLIERYPGPNGRFPDELYDLAKDPHESHNVIDDSTYADDLRDLRAALAGFFQQYQIESRRGDRIADQHRCNPCETWHLDPQVTPQVQP